MAKRVRYQVLKPVFVNGSLIDPAAAKGGGPVFVMADEGLEGEGLKLAPEPPPARRPRAPKEDGLKDGDAGTGTENAGDAGDRVP